MDLFQAQQQKRREKQVGADGSLLNIKGNNKGKGVFNPLLLLLLGASTSLEALAEKSGVSIGDLQSVDAVRLVEQALMQQGMTLQQAQNAIKQAMEAAGGEQQAAQQMSAQIVDAINALKADGQTVTDASLKGIVDQLAMQIKSGDWSGYQDAGITATEAAVAGAEMWPALLGLAALGGGGGGGAAAASSSGFVVKGPIKDAAVFRDANKNFIMDGDEGDTQTTTEADGSYTLSGSGGVIVATGGTDTTTNNAFTGLLAAPSGATVVTPLTTLLAADPTLTVADLQSTLGLAGVDILTFNPFASDADATQALAAEKAAAQISVVLESLATVAVNAGGGTANVSLGEAFSAVAKSVATFVQTQADGNATVDLTDTTQLNAIAAEAKSTVSADLGVTLTDSVLTSIVADAQTSNTAIGAQSSLEDVATQLDSIQDDLAASSDNAAPTVASAITDQAVDEDAEGTGGTALPGSYTLENVSRENLQALLDGDEATTGQSPTITVDLSDYTFADSGASSVDVTMLLARSESSTTNLKVTLNDVQIDVAGDDQTLVLPSQSVSATVQFGSEGDYATLGTYTINNLDADQLTLTQGENTSPSLQLKLDSLFAKMTDGTGDVLNLNDLSVDALVALGGGIALQLSDGRTPTEMLDLVKSYVTMPSNMDTVGEAISLVQSSIDFPELSSITLAEVKASITDTDAVSLLNSFMTLLGVQDSDSLSSALTTIADSSFASWSVAQLSDQLNSTVGDNFGDDATGTSTLNALLVDVGNFVISEAESRGVDTETILSKITEAVITSSSLEALIASVDLSNFLPEGSELLPIIEQIRDTGTIDYADMVPLASRVLFDNDTVLTVTIDDLQGLTVSKSGTEASSFEVTVPIGSESTVEQTSTGGEALSFQIPTGTFSDADGDDLSYFATLADGTALPDWLTFTEATSTLSGTPTNDDVGVITVRITAMDSVGNTVYDDFTVTVNNTNDAPTVATEIADTAVTEFATASIDVSASFADVDSGDTLTFTAAGLPTGLSISAEGVITGTVLEVSEDTDYSVTVTATDSASVAVEDTFVLTVNNDTTAPDAPTIALHADTGTDTADGITGNGQINVSGLESGATWEYRTSDSGSWTEGNGSSFTLNGSADGIEYATIQVRQIDAAGNASEVIALGSTITVVTAPDAPTIDLATDTGVSASDGITNDATISVSGLVSGGTWEYSIDGGDSWNDGTVTGEATSSFELTAGTTYAVNDIQVRQTNAVGIESNETDKNGEAVTVDTTAPTLSISEGVLDTTTGTFTYTFTFSESVTTFAVGDVTVTNGTAGTFTAQSATTYTLEVTPDAENDPVSLDVSVAAAGVTDQAGNALAAEASAVAQSVLYGTSGNNTLNPGSAADTIYLAGGTDTIVIDAVTDSTSSAADTVIGFASGDKIDLSALIGDSGAGYTGESTIPTGTSNSDLELVAGNFVDNGTVVVATVDVYYRGADPIDYIEMKFLDTASGQAYGGMSGFFGLDDDYNTNPGYGWAAGTDNDGVFGSGFGEEQTTANPITTDTLIGTVTFTMPTGTDKFIAAIYEASVSYVDSSTEISITLPDPAVLSSDSSAGLAMDNEYLVEVETSLSAVGDNEIHISQDAVGNVEIRYDTDSSAGTTVASDIIHIEGISSDDIDLTKTDFVFV